MQHYCHQTRQRGIEKTLQSPVDRGKEEIGDSAFIEVGFFFIVACRDEFIDNEERFGRGRFFRRPCLACQKDNL